MSWRRGSFLYACAAALAAVGAFQWGGLQSGRMSAAGAAEKSARSKPHDPQWDYQFEDPGSKPARPPGTSVRSKTRDPQWSVKFEDPADDSDNVLEKVLAQNSADGPQPAAPVQHASVTVSSGTDLPIESQSRGRTRVRVGGEAVLSPAVADGRVFVGGGFNSTQFYCLNSDSGHLVWSARLADNGPSAPSYERGTVLFTTESCTCYALDAATGRGLWSMWLGDPVITAPTIAGDNVLVCYPGGTAPPTRPKPAKRPSRTTAAGVMTPRTAPRPAPRPAMSPPTGFIFAARNLRNGVPVWQKWIDGFVMSAPVVYGKDVYAVTFAGTLYKFRLSDGEILLARNCRSTSAPVVLADGIYLTRRADEGQDGIPQECLVKLDPATGKQIYAASKSEAPHLADAVGRAHFAWVADSADTAAAPAAQPSPHGSLKRKSLAPDDPDYEPGGAVATNVAQDVSPSGRLVGRSSPLELQAFCGSRMAACGDKLFNCMGSELVATDKSTGRRCWGLSLDEPWRRGDIAEPVAVPPAVADGKLIVASRDGRLFSIDGETGKVLDRIDLGAPASSQPIVEGGRIFVGTTKGELVLIRTGNPRFTGWNQWGGDAAHSGIARQDPAAKRAVASR